MKVRKFYPGQVMKKLATRRPNTLDDGERAALSFFMRRARRVTEAILDRKPQRIFLT